MKRNIRLGTIGLAILAVCVIDVSAQPNKTPTRPYKISGDTVGEITAITVTPTDVSITFEFNSTGVASHSGRYSNIGTTTLSLVTHQGTAEGTFTTASGDDVYWVGNIDGTTLAVNATGGTGRFEGGFGGFVAQISDLVIDPMPPVVGGTISYTFEGTGTVTY